MVNLAKLLERLDDLPVAGRADALALIGFLLLRGPTEDRMVRRAFAPFLNGHPAYMATITGVLFESGLLESIWGPKRKDEVGDYLVDSTLLRIRPGALPALLEAQGVPFILGHDVQHYMPRPPGWLATVNVVEAEAADPPGTA